jgi:hypothetical protein
MMIADVLLETCSRLCSVKTGCTPFNIRLFKFLGGHRGMGDRQVGSKVEHRF